MRLWHEQLIPLLPRQQLLGQHRECCALRGLGWGKKHLNVNYAFKYKMSFLYNYHISVMIEMLLKDMDVNASWINDKYRGLKCEKISSNDFCTEECYPEHDDIYLSENLHNLKYSLNSKGKVKNIDLFSNFPYIKDEGFYDKPKWKEFFIRIGKCCFYNIY